MVRRNHDQREKSAREELSSGRQVHEERRAHVANITPMKADGVSSGLKEASGARETRKMSVLDQRLASDLRVSTAAAEPRPSLLHRLFCCCGPSKVLERFQDIFDSGEAEEEMWLLREKVYSLSSVLGNMESRMQLSDLSGTLRNWRDANDTKKHLIAKHIETSYGYDGCLVVTDMSGFTRVTREEGILHFMMLIKQMQVGPAATLHQASSPNAAPAPKHRTVAAAACPRPSACPSSSASEADWSRWRQMISSSCFQPRARSSPSVPSSDA